MVNADGAEADTIKEVTASLDMVLQNAADNSRGTIDYAARASVGEPPRDTITLALIPLKGITETVGTGLCFVFTAPRRTDVLFEDASVLGDYTDASVALMTCRSSLHLALVLREQGDLSTAVPLRAAKQRVRRLEP